MSFEPTQPQSGVDPNMYTLIDPDAIPYPLTDVESLASAAETLRTKGQDLLDGAEDLRSTWKGLDAHYEAPESEKLFSKMDPVATRGEDLQSDLSTVADALEELAEAAKTARRSLNNLRIDAQGLWNRNHDKAIWWLTKDEQTDEWALLENIRIKDAVNSAWSTFNQAENDCANKISALFGGPTYVSPGEGGGKDVRVYGLAPDAGERDLSLDHALSFEGINGRFNDFAGWAGNKIDPSNVEWGNDAGQAVWDVVVTDTLWGAAVGLTTKLGYWGPKSGWRFDLSGRWENFKAAWKGAALDTAALVGVHDEHGWLWEPGEGGREGWGAGWDRWLGNVEASKDELVEGYTAWSTREDGTSYSNTTMIANAAMFTGGLPLKAAKLVLGAGVDAPNGKHSSESPDSEEEGGSDKSAAHGGPGTNGWPSSPLPQRPGGGAPTTERFEHSLKTVRESLLDPNRLRPAPSGRPDRPNPAPTPDSGSDSPSQQPGTPQRGGTPNDQEGRTPPARPGDKGAQERPEKEEKEDAGLPGRAGEKPGAPAPPGRPASESPRVRENGQDDGPVQHRDDDQEEAGKPGEEPKRPDPAAAGGAGGDADDPPKDRTTTGGGDDEGADDRSDPESAQHYVPPAIGTPEFEARFDELKIDPAKGGAPTKPSAAYKARVEVEVGISAERQGIVEPPVRRPTSADLGGKDDVGDFIDANGQRWDVKSPTEYFPPTAGKKADQFMPPGLPGRHTMSDLVVKIDDEISKRENVLLDLRRLTPESRQEVIEYIATRQDWASHVYVVDV
ncbi:hypothetical protein [Nocardiopsis baichengensis]|uniref:hypothetical protein n=1 Tax=Nocardiopsis baichengensis TaxID=280240 RepID=UPI000349914F|nr:hypothetical protein [Nocardiopsis baichengensis]